MLRAVHDLVSPGSDARTQAMLAPIYNQGNRYSGLDAPGACEDVRDAQPNAYDHSDGLYDKGDNHEPHRGLAPKVHGEH